MAVNTLTVGPGKLTIGADTTLMSFESQITECALKPKSDTDDPIYVLSGEAVAGDRTESWTLEGTMLQDFGATASKAEWLFSHRGQTLPFTFTPNNASGRSVTGQLVVEPVELGGKVRTKVLTDFSFPVVGDPVLGPSA